MRVKARWLPDETEWQEGRIVSGSLESGEIIIAWDHDPPNPWEYERGSDKNWYEVNDSQQPIEIVAI
jgi:hypothetical protein